MQETYKKLTEGNNLNIYYKYVNDRVIIIYDLENRPAISICSIHNMENIEGVEIDHHEFYDVFNRVQRTIQDLLLNIEYNEGYKLTTKIANLVRNYDYYHQYIEDGGQRRKQEEKNYKIYSELKELGVKSFNGIKIN